MKVQPVRIVGIHPHTYRAGLPGWVTGVMLVTPEGSGGRRADSPSARPCFQVSYPDGEVDYIPVSDIESYRFIP